MEIERKFIPASIPEEFLQDQCYLLEQAYVQTSPVIRVRQKATITDGQAIDPQYILTVKSSGMMTRQEFELPLTAKEYNELLAKADGNIITEKNRLVKKLGVN